MAFGDRATNNSIYATNFYPLYSATSHAVASGDVVDRRQMIYYSGVSATKTQEMAGNAVLLRDSLPTGWNGVIATDPDSIRYLLVSNFVGATTADMKALRLPEGAPVFSVPTDIAGGKSVAHFSLATLRSVGNTLRVFVTSGTITAQQGTDSTSTYLTNNTGSIKSVGLMIITANGKITGTVNVPANSRVLVTINDGELFVANAPLPKDPANDITVLVLKNAGFDASPVTYDVAGTLNTNAVNMWAGLNYSSAFAYNVANWTNRSIVAGNSTFTATYAYGSAAKLNAITIPATDKNGISTGACLGVSSGWGIGNTVQFTQKVSMPAGRYILNYDAYNGNTTSTTVVSNLSGFRNGATTMYDATTNFASSAWTTPSVAASFSTPFQGEVSVGACCSNASSNAGPKLLIDNVRILTDQSIESVESFYWNTAKDSAQLALNRYPAITSDILYTNLRSALLQTYSTITECASAIQTLQDATAKFLVGAPTGITTLSDTELNNTPQNIYNLEGQLLSSKKYTKAEALNNLKDGLYIIGNEKVIVKTK
jgi:hypothetical protein